LVEWFCSLKEIAGVCNNNQDHLLLSQNESCIS
jgi:hypothetical protein